MDRQDHAILWKRLDAPGHDACRLAWTGDGWILEGVSASREENRPSALTYRVLFDHRWRTRRGRITGSIGRQHVDLRVRRLRRGVWTLNDGIVPALEDCVDLDLGFTPATNLSQLRRTALAIGSSADVPVAWLDAATGALDRVPQRYERRTESTWWYESPTFAYAAILDVGPEGFVRRYPGLWEAES